MDPVTAQQLSRSAAEIANSRFGAALGQGIGDMLGGGSAPSYTASGGIGGNSYRADGWSVATGRGNARAMGGSEPAAALAAIPAQLMDYLPLALIVLGAVALWKR